MPVCRSAAAPASVRCGKRDAHGRGGMLGGCFTSAAFLCVPLLPGNGPVRRALYRSAVPAACVLYLPVV